MKFHILLSILIFFLVLIATASGIFYKTPGSAIEYVTIRGEKAIYQGSGLYRFDPTWIALEGIVWDVINLLIGLPLLAVAIYLSQRNSLRGQLLLGGLLFYFFYVYLMAMAGYALNRMFFVYVAIFALSSVAFFLDIYVIDVAQLPSQVSARFPRRLFIGFTFLMGAFLIFLWSGRILPIIASDRFPPDMAGLNTPVSQGIDLGIVVPLLLSAGILLWRRSPWGYLLTAINLGYGLLMCITLPAFIAVPLLQEGKTNWVESSPLLALSLVGFFLTWKFYGNIKEESRLSLR